MPRLIAGSSGNATNATCLADTEPNFTPRMCMDRALGYAGLPWTGGLGSNPTAAQLSAALPAPKFPTLRPISHVRNIVSAGSALGDLLVELLNTPLLGWFCASVVVILYLLERMRVAVLDEYLDQKYAELNRECQRMEQQIAVRQRRIDMLSMR